MPILDAQGRPSVPDSDPSADAELSRVVASVAHLSEELERLRKILLRHGHAQEHFQQRVEEQVDRLAGHLTERAATEKARPSGEHGETLTRPQLQSLLDLDRAVLHLRLFARGGDRGQVENVLEDAPASVREGLDLLQIRVRNLQRSFNLEPIPALKQTFDDRVHQVHSVCHRPDAGEDQIVEELLPGYRLDGKVIRPALVVVNRTGGDAPAEPATPENRGGDE